MRINDYLSMSLLSSGIPVEKVLSVLDGCGCRTIRHRKLPRELLVHYVVCLPLCAGVAIVAIKEVLRCMLEGFHWLGLPCVSGLAAGKSAISQARSVLGEEPLWRLFEKVRVRMAGNGTMGGVYKSRLLVGAGGSTLGLPDERRNDEEFGRPGSRNGSSSFPRLRFVAFLELGTRAIFSAACGRYRERELALAEKAAGRLPENMLRISDRGFGCHSFCPAVLGRGANSLVRVRAGQAFEIERNLPDGSLLCRMCPSRGDRLRRRNGIPVRIIEYRLDGVPGAGHKYVLAASLLDHAEAPAAEVVAPYHERWEVGTAYDEIKSHLKPPGEKLRSKPRNWPGRSSGDACWPITLSGESCTRQP